MVNTASGRTEIVCNACHADIFKATQVETVLREVNERVSAPHNADANPVISKHVNRKNNHGK